MKFKSLGLLSVLATCFSLAYHVAAQAGGSSLSNMDESMARQRESLQRMRDFLGPDVVQGSEESQTPKRAASAAPPTITFSNPAAQQFYVDGSTLPDGT